MNAAETIAAAIEKLEAESARAMQGPWFRTHPLAIVKVVAHSAEVVAGQSFDDYNADLIVTLRRTVDAQLGVLRAILDTHLNSIPLLFDEYEVWPIPAYALDLARAIVGVSS